MEHIYAITTIGLPDRDTQPHDITVNEIRYRVRTVGVYKSEEDARRVLTSNWGGLSEDGYYEFAIIEELPFGLYPIPTWKAIFKFVDGTREEGWQLCEEIPEPIRNYMSRVYNFCTIG